MKVIAKKIVQGEDTILFTGKGINNPSSGEVLKLSLLSLIVSGATSDGNVTLTLEALDQGAQSVKSITIAKDNSVYEGNINEIISRKMSFTDAYSVKIQCSSSATVYFEYEQVQDPGFVSFFKTNNQ
tara:strand:+ start:192 stop:572 length:381 start_codon:yes stop_codon:yes gene_type:complete